MPNPLVEVTPLDVAIFYEEKRNMIIELDYAQDIFDTFIFPQLISIEQVMKTLHEDKSKEYMFQVFEKLIPRTHI